MSRSPNTYGGRVVALMEVLPDEDLNRGEMVRFLRLDNDGLPEAVLIFDPITGRREKASLPLTAHRVA